MLRELQWLQCCGVENNAQELFVFFFFSDQYIWQPNYFISGVPKRFPKTFIFSRLPEGLWSKIDLDALLWILP